MPTPCAAASPSYHLGLQQATAASPLEQHEMSLHVGIAPCVHGKTIPNLMMIGPS